MNLGRPHGASFSWHLARTQRAAGPLSVLASPDVPPAKAVPSQIWPRNGPSTRAGQRQARHLLQVAVAVPPSLSFVCSSNTSPHSSPFLAEVSNSKGRHTIWLCQ